MREDYIRRLFLEIYARKRKLDSELVKLNAPKSIRQQLLNIVIRVRRLHEYLLTEKPNLGEDFSILLNVDDIIADIEIIFDNAIKNHWAFDELWDQINSLSFENKIYKNLPLEYQGQIEAYKRARFDGLKFLLDKSIEKDDKQYQYWFDLTNPEISNDLYRVQSIPEKEIIFDDVNIIGDDIEIPDDVFIDDEINNKPKTSQEILNELSEEIYDKAKIVAQLTGFYIDDECRKNEGNPRYDVEIRAKQGDSMETIYIDLLLDHIDRHIYLPSSPDVVQLFFDVYWIQYTGWW